ncbi:MAG: hypothetical protein IH937_08670 [Acidobacteria bacterium]|nr:hypothetical protein [Acidobacteriota bacterium]MCH8015743.1 hypothetical protein [Acidobacteriota bacterium]
MDSKQVRKIVEELLTEMEIFALPGPGYKWDVEESVKQLKPDHYNLSFEVPELGTRSISFSTPPGSTPDSIKLAMAGKIEAAVRRTSYKDYEVHAASLLLPSGEWSLEVHITLQRDDEIQTKPFTGSDTFFSEVEAIRHGLDFGKRIIDGKVEDCSVEDL